jgi:PAS domain S-box-containing protein
VSEAAPCVRIVVLESRDRAAPSEHSARVSDRDTTRALERLGEGVELDLVWDAETCLALCEKCEIDLVVVDRVTSEQAVAVLRALHRDGPPVVVVTGGQNERESLDAFRSGAAECIRVGPDYQDLLPVVALEQIRRWRQARERGEAEQRIRWLESLNDAIVTEIPAALAVVDGRERIVTVNPEFSRAMSVDADRAVDRNFEEVFPPDLVESGSLREMFAECAADRSPAPRLARTRNGGEDGDRVFDVRAQRLDEEGRVLLVLSDVSEREKLVKRIAGLKRYNENIIQNMNSAMLVVDDSGEITFANATAERILGSAAGRLTGRQIWDWFGPAPRDRELLRRTLDDGLRFKGAETVVRREDRSVVPIGISCAPLTDADGSKLGAVAIFQDLTEIKQLQRQVLQTEKMASIGQLAAGVAHEINNPMGFIHANLFQMSEYLADLRRVWEKVEALAAAASGDELARVERAAEEFSQLAKELDISFVLRDFSKAIRESQEGSERIRHIVKDLRDFSHQDTAERVSADVNQCVDSTASIVWTMMKHSVVLRKQYRDLPQIPCFPMQLKQVFMNLLVNAYQAIEERIGNSGETGEIEIRTDRVGNGVVISIRDTGVGIPAEVLARIFDPFFTTKEVGAGTGLGLSTSYSIVQRHGGTIRVESRRGEGTTFEVWLPVDGPMEQGEGEKRGG